LEARGAKTSRHVADVSDAVRMQALPGEVVAAHGAVHIVVSHADVLDRGS
jgi:NAD(P)-dependent dehydrogenase (short-subunit alcohol dehydrogenase family)